MGERRKGKKSGDVDDADSRVRAGDGKDELRRDQALQNDASFEELRERADAVDRVMTKKGDPEMDWTSG